MQLNQATDYAFRAVLYMAMQVPGAVISGKSLAAKQAIPQRFVLKIMHSLTKAGLTKSHRGSGGGFSLARPAAGITLYDVVVAMEGPPAIHRCLAEREWCNRHCTAECPVHRALAGLQEQLVSGLRAANFAALADQAREAIGEAATDGEEEIE